MDKATHPPKKKPTTYVDCPNAVLGNDVPLHSFAVDAVSGDGLQERYFVVYMEM